MRVYANVNLNEYVVEWGGDPLKGDGSCPNPPRGLGRCKREGSLGVPSGLVDKGKTSIATFPRSNFIQNLGLLFFRREGEKRAPYFEIGKRKGS